MRMDRSTALGRLRLEPEEEAARKRGLLESGVKPDALGQVQVWTERFIRFGEVPGHFKRNRLCFLIAAIVLVVLGSWFAWLESSPMPTRPEGGGYWACLAFWTFACILLLFRRTVVPGRFKPPRAMIDLERRRWVWPDGEEADWDDMQLVMSQWHSRTGMADTLTSIELPIEYSWDMVAFPKSRPFHGGPYSQSRAVLRVLESADFAHCLELGRALLALGIASPLYVDPPLDLEGRLRPLGRRLPDGFEVLP